MPEREILTPSEVLARFRGGPRTGVFTDGSCEGNPGRGGWGWVWVLDDEIRGEGHGTDPATTNNRMELTALIRALRALPEDAEIPVYSDSELCVKTINEWAAGWEARGWRRKSGPIANLELVKELWALARSHPRAEIRWIRAHDGSRWNEYADALASGYLLGPGGR
jgi:ribonuclease HI